VLSLGLTPKGIVLPVSAFILANIDQYVELDRARTRLRDEIDWPGQSLDLFINIVRQGGGTLSQTKRRSQFDWMKDEEIERFVPVVNEAFEVDAALEPGSGLVAIKCLSPFAGPAIAYPCAADPPSPKRILGGTSSDKLDRNRVLFSHSYFPCGAVCNISIAPAAGRAAT
jgi:hypothetical protein